MKLTENTRKKIQALHDGFMKVSDVCNSFQSSLNKTFIGRLQSAFTVAFLWHLGMFVTGVPIDITWMPQFNTTTK